MAPIKANTAAPVATPSKPQTPPDLATLATAEQTANTAQKDLKTQLKAADDAAKASPKNPALAAKRDALLTQTKAALETWEKAKGALEKALGGGTQGEQAQKLIGQLPAAQQQADALQKQLNALTKPFVKSVDDAVASKGAPKDMKDATAKQAQVKVLEARLAEVKGKIKGLEGAIESREEAMLAQAKAKKLPGAADVADLGDLASRTLEEQVRLAGAPVVTVDREKALKLDVDRIAAATKVSPENGVKMLQLQLKGADFGNQFSLLNKASGDIAKMVTAAQTDPKVATALLDTLKMANPTARSVLAKQMLEGVNSQFSPILTAAAARLGSSDGTVEASALVSAMKFSGGGAKAVYAGPLDAMVSGKVAAAKADFLEKTKDIEKLNGDLARLVVGFGPMLSAEEKGKAIEAFKANHKEDYAKWEASGAQLAPMMQYALESNDSQLKDLIPSFLDTKAGAAAVMEGLAAQEAKQPGLLDALPNLQKYGNDGVKAYQAISTAMVKGVGLRAIDLTRAGKVGEAQKLVSMLNENHALFGVEKKAMEGLTQKMGDVLASGGAKASLDGLKKEFQNVDANAPGFTGRSAQALKGLGVALSAISVIDNMRNFDELALKDQIKTVADGIGTGVDGGLLAMEVIGKSNPASKAIILGKRVSAVAGAVGAVMDGISSVEAFRRGDHAEGIAGGVSAVGGAILATYAFAAAAGMQALPVAGQVVGAVLVIGGTIAKWTIEERKLQKQEDVLEKDAKAFLKAAGVPEAQADKLNDIKRADGRNVGMMLSQLADYLKVDPRKLFEHVKKMSPDQVEKLVDMTKDWKVDDKGRFPLTGKDSLNVAANWMKEDGILPKDIVVPAYK